MIATTTEDIALLKEGGSILAGALEYIAHKARAGVTTAALDIAAEEYIRARGAVPAFLNYKPAAQLAADAQRFL